MWKGSSPSVLKHFRDVVMRSLRCAQRKLARVARRKSQLARRSPIRSVLRKSERSQGTALQCECRGPRAEADAHAGAVANAAMPPGPARLHWPANVTFGGGRLVPSPPAAVRSNSIVSVVADEPDSGASVRSTSRRCEATGQAHRRTPLHFVPFRCRKPPETGGDGAHEGSACWSNAVLGKA